MATNKAVKLDEFEENLERSFHQDTWRTVTDPKEREKAMNAAKFSKSERTNIRLSEGDLMGIKKKAHEKAREILNRADTHMALEDQKVRGDLNQRIERLAKKLLEKGDVW